jgi:hypothetical protein
MRKMLGISFIVQAVFFLAMFAALFQYGDESLPVLHVKASIFLYALVIFGFSLSIAAVGVVFSKMALKNDGKLALLIGQVSLLSLIMLQGSFSLLVIAIIPMSFAFMFWRQM